MMRSTVVDSSEMAGNWALINSDRDLQVLLDKICHVGRGRKSNELILQPECAPVCLGYSTDILVDGVPGVIRCEVKLVADCFIRQCWRDGC